jgi:hypothetical protein
MARQKSTQSPAPDSPIVPDAEVVATQPQVVAETQELPAPASSATLPNKTPLHLAIGAAVALTAAALGYGAALQFPLGASGQASIDPAPLQAEIDALKTASAAHADIAARLAAMQAEIDAAAALPQRIASLEAAISALPKPDPNLAAELATIRARLAQTDPAPMIKAAIAAEIGQVQDSAAAMVAQVETAAQTAITLAAQTALRSALDTGAPFAAAAASLTLPPVLADNAQTGIPSLTALKDSFPDAARAGLEAALRADMGQTWAERVQNFLRNQTGARSLTPREGGDPNAVLSRIEAALRAGNLDAALTEVAALPPAAQTVMADWIATAQLRADALAALDSVTAKGN